MRIFDCFCSVLRAVLVKPSRTWPVLYWWEVCPGSIHISAKLGVKFANVSFTASFTVLLPVKLLNSAADDLQSLLQVHHLSQDNLK